MNNKNKTNGREKGKADGKRVLLADKDVVTTMELEELLRSNGFTNLSVESVNSGGRLKERLSTVTPDMLILGDLQFDTQRPGDKSSQSSTTDEFTHEALRESFPDSFIIDMRNTRRDGEYDSKRRVINMAKPIEDEAFLEKN